MAAVQRVIDSEDDIYEAMSTMRGFWQSDATVLVAALTACTGNRQLRALACMCNFARQIGLTTVDAAQVLPVLVKFLDTAGFPDTQCEALEILAHIATLSNPKASLVAAELPLIVRLTRGRDCRVTCTALKALACLATLAITIQSTFDHSHGGVLSLLRFNEKPEIIIGVLEVLTPFVCSSASGSAFHSTCISLSAKFIYYKDTAVQTAAVKFTRLFLLDHAVERHAAFIGMAPRIARLMLHPNEDLAAAATAWASGMSGGNEGQKQALVDAGVLPICGRIIVERSEMLFAIDRGVMDTSEMAKAAARTISSILAGTPVQIQAVIDAELIPLLMQQVHSLACEMADIAIKALRKMCSQASPPQLLYLLDEGMLMLCSELLREETHAEHVLILAALACVEVILDRESEVIRAVGLCSAGDVLEYCEFLEFPTLLVTAGQWFSAEHVESVLAWFPAHSGVGAALLLKALGGANIVEDIMDAIESDGVDTYVLDEALEYMHSNRWSRRRHALHAWAIQWGVALS